MVVACLGSPKDERTAEVPQIIREVATARLTITTQKQVDQADQADWAVWTVRWSEIHRSGQVERVRHRSLV